MHEVLLSPSAGIRCCCLWSYWGLQKQQLSTHRPWKTLMTVVGTSVFHTHLAQGQDVSWMKISSSLANCNRTHHNHPSAFLRKGNIIVTDIWLSGELRVYSDFAQDCYNSSGQSTYNNDPWIRLSKFPTSHTKNKFTAISCDTYVCHWLWHICFDKRF